MHKKYKIVIILLLILGFLTVAVWYLQKTNIPVLEPKGTIGLKERNLMVFTVLLGLLVIIPVFIMTTVIAWKYRESNTKAKYTPDWDRHRLAEVAWWGIPLVFISVLSVVTWVSTHALDPYKPLASKTPQMTIQVVALDWKWLFIYPKQNIASVNLAQLPVNTPIDFEITSDTVMNSFWVPQLGGQIYAMPGMTTHLHLMATQTGSFNGSSANISGSGFAGMTFVAKSSSSADFNAWVRSVKQSPNRLSMNAYNTLARPSQNNKVTYYSSGLSSLYNTITAKYMMPTNPPASTNSQNASSKQPKTTSNNMQGMYMP